MERFAAIPYSITRRSFGKVLTGSIGAAAFPGILRAAGNPFTIAFIPDPQGLAGDPSTLDGNGVCGASGMYSRMIQWGIANRNLMVNGSPLNIKGFINVGDTCNDTSATAYGTQQQRAVAACNLAEAASPKMFMSRQAGNHDYEGGGFAANGVNRALLAPMWRENANGVWRPSAVASIYGSGIDLGDGDAAYWGDVFPDSSFATSMVNNYMRLSIQGMKILLITVEIFPRSEVLRWAKTIHDAWPDHQCWLTTHSYMDHLGTIGGHNTFMGPGQYLMADAPASNSGSQIWGGSDSTWPGCSGWNNLTMIVGGHFIDGYVTGWVWKYSTSTSTSPRRQAVNNIFVNTQEADLAHYCPGGIIDGVSDIAHLMLCRISPATQTMETFMVSTNTGLWTGNVGTRSNPTPVQLFTAAVPAPGVPASNYSRIKLTPLPSPGKK